MSSCSCVVLPFFYTDLCGNAPHADATYCDGQESIYRGVQRFMGGEGR